ncbi:hypothetical protein RchiOBHm_Chr7g0204931 [Rosa chinensis]|uniref:Transmembrane protein n=1 Tax=Rosa chinensis TaxID=74649 RepID=A0A2P6P8T7_ROSCH|nr:hypothetical protein RchiOBHm_Chr7g0204931 [Rosa chinensis]
MHRSASAPRVSGDFPVNPSSTSPQQQQQSSTTTTHNSEHHHDQDLPTYDPLSHAAKRERSRIKSAENAIHLIPLVLALCAIILWFFSNPA